MILSRVELDIERRSTKYVLTSPGRMHIAVESAFSGERKRRLWRVDQLGEKLYLLILSEDQPKLDILARRYGNEAAPEWQSKDYAPVLSRAKQASLWQFRLAANPTKSVLGEKGKRGIVKACVSVKEQEEWLTRQAEKHGFSLRSGAFRVVQSKWHIFGKAEKAQAKVSLRGVTFEGLLTVTDEEKFREVLTKGLGRGKAYGMGLLTIVPAVRD